jgi:hypothetical protein
MPLRTIGQAALVKSTDKSGNSRNIRASSAEDMISQLDRIAWLPHELFQVNGIVLQRWTVFRTG